MKRFIVLAAITAMFAAPLAAAPAEASPTTPSNPAAATAYQGTAYGTEATIRGSVTSGASAPVTIGCTTSAGQHKTNTAAGVDFSPLFEAGTITTAARASDSPTTAKTSATVQDVDLLDGLVVATAVRSVSATRQRASGFATSARGTRFTDLVVAGVPINDKVNPNTRIEIPGFGYVVLNQQSGRIGKRTARLTVDAIHVVVTQTNELGIPKDTEAVIGHASSALAGPVSGTLDGFAYGSRALAARNFSSGPSFRVSLPCFGTNGRLRLNEGAGISIPTILNTGAIHDTATGLADESGASGETTSTVDSTTLLDSLLTATAIKADAHAVDDGSGPTFSDDGSGFATLAVRGFPNIGPDVKPNTRLHIAGLGNLWLHRVVQHTHGIEVRMIELVVRHDNAYALPVGARVQVAVAHASVH